MSTQVLIGVERFTVKHRITLTENFYELRTLGPNDEHGEIVAFARMEQMTLPEEFRFFADKERRAPLFSFRAQTRMNLGHATYDVLDAGGMRIGYLQHQFFASKVRETWRLGAPGVEAVGHQRSEAVGVLRRTWRQVPILGMVTVPFLFDVVFTEASGRVVMTSERLPSMRDRYVVTVPGGALDPRVAAAMAVALDGLYK